MKLTPSAATSIMNIDQIKSSSSFITAFELSVDFAMDIVTDEHLDALAALRASGVEYSVHAPFRDLNIASLNDGAYQAARADMMRAIRIADRVGATAINVHPGIHGYYPAEFWPRMKRLEQDVFEELSAFGADRGIRVMVENLIKTNVHFEDTWTLDGIIQLHDEWDADNKGVCLDTGHAHQAGLNVAEALRRLGKRVRHLHLHDNHGGPIDEHLPIGDGTIEWEPFFQVLEELDFQGYGVFEFGPPPRQERAVELLRDRFGSLVGR
ncbi:sugar phosphate isomerase/epimerase [Rugosimonospora acidiphila]|uniref:Sugar phosphate isomerase/epimerase n=1 Tax=Rugosimonospora acidiphila TaxID=556531 RepID=A0ABP9SBI3_9ACTN